ncbi:Trigger factor [Mycoplasmopsis maculosa]|uniref:Trigger factor n=1 Tax=Mycoplasmopsis maculosa TaxID=114885 RepID=A0A449B4P9_9BACT|nr:trigger factor [Mycoplasmopsis maculosa]VEU75508.1 Trigger factor [Mycoplasmopsis maculosa]
MNIKNIELNKEKMNIVVEVEFSGESWKKVFNETKTKKVKELKIPGFRPGKAPKHEIEKRITPVAVAYDAVYKAYETEAEQIIEGIKKEHSNIVMMPALVDMPVLSEEKAVIKLQFPLEPDFSNYSLDDVKVEVEKISVSTKEVEEAITRQLQSNALLMPISKTEKTKLGDTVTLNYKGYVNDEAFEGGEAEGFELKLGSKTFIDTFEDQLVDKKIGYKGEVKVTFPEQYPVDKLRGQLATFDVEIVDAKRPESVEINDEAVKTLNVPGVNTVEELKKYVKDQLIVSKTLISLNTTVNSVVQELKTKHNPTVSNEVAKPYADKKLTEVRNQLKQQNIKLSEYLSVIQKSEEEFSNLILEEEKAQLINNLVASSLFKKYSAELSISELGKQVWALETAMQSGLPLELVISFIEPKEGEDASKTEMYYKEAALEFEFKQFVAKKLGGANAEANLKALSSIISKQIENAKKAAEEQKAKTKEAEKSKEETK